MVCIGVLSSPCCSVALLPRPSSERASDDEHSTSERDPSEGLSRAHELGTSLRYHAVDSTRSPIQSLSRAANSALTSSLSALTSSSSARSSFVRAFAALSAFDVSACVEIRADYTTETS